MSVYASDRVIHNVLQTNKTYLNIKRAYAIAMSIYRGGIHFLGRSIPDNRCVDCIFVMNSFTPYCLQLLHMVVRAETVQAVYYKATGYQ